jgi:tetratricopeptide (TPR) repeat protein
MAGDDLEAAFREANRLYERGDYESAAAAYDRLLGNAPGAASLHFNLGNAWFRAGRLGQAIWHYRVARDLSPRDEDIRMNLLIARSQVGGQDSIREGRTWRWIGALTLNEWAAVSAWLFWCVMGSMVLAQLKPRFRRPMLFWARLLAFAWVGSVVALGVVWHEVKERRIAIVIDEAAVRYGPFEESQVQFTASDGTELKVLEWRDDWVRVDNSRVVGWADRSRVRIYPEDRNPAGP